MGLWSSSSSTPPLLPSCFICIPQDLARYGFCFQSSLSIFLCAFFFDHEFLKGVLTSTYLWISQISFSYRFLSSFHICSQSQGFRPTVRKFFHQVVKSLQRLSFMTMLTYHLLRSLFPSRLCRSISWEGLRLLLVASLEFSFQYTHTQTRPIHRWMLFLNSQNKSPETL